MKKQNWANNTKTLREKEKTKKQNWANNTKTVKEKNTTVAVRPLKFLK